jgi:3-phenylpropionate/trans-cinnamate dioxygenase ferredoxin subunit
LATFHKVAKLSELTPNELRAVLIDKTEVAVVSVAGKVIAFSDMCPHAMCTLSPGTVQGDRAICECHGSEFNIYTGEALAGPAGGHIPVYPVKVEGDDIYVEV